MTIPLSQLPPNFSDFFPSKDTSPVEFAEAVGFSYISSSKPNDWKDIGHYLTPAAIARFMAEQSSYSQNHMRVLDPGIGTGILSAAICEAAQFAGKARTLHIDAYETDQRLAELSRLVLNFSREWLAQRGLDLTFDVVNGDFVLEYAAALAPTLWTRRSAGHSENEMKYSLVISNPPYFKIGKDDPRAQALASVIHGQPNIYAIFMAISAELLSKGGDLVYIVPRSFASGPYFKKFRRIFFQRVSPTAIHLFDSRKDVFKKQTVLQESLVIAARRPVDGEAIDEGQVLVSHSKAAHDLNERQRFLVDINSILDLDSESRELSIPVCTEDLELAHAMQGWPNTLHSLGLEISTGPVVPFRATNFLSRSACEHAVPLLWMQHVRPMKTSWPLPTAEKPQWIQAVPASKKLLVRDATYVLLRRFSAKEEKRRLVAAPLLRGSLDEEFVGLENHLNYIRGVSRVLDEDLAYGLAALLNSTFLDRFFRISNGNTQVSATELRAMPLPAERDIRHIGVEIQRGLGSMSNFPDLDALVGKALNLSAELRAGLELSAR